MHSLPKDPLAATRLLTKADVNEDAAIIRMPDGKALVQTIDFLTPVVNDPFAFGRIAAANSLSDVYAMGGQPWTAMNIVCYPLQQMDKETLIAILQGGAEATQEAGAVLAGGHSVEDSEIKFGLSVTGIIDPDNFASNAGLCEDDVLILTKPIGTGILATAIKARWEQHEQMEQELIYWAGKLNKVGGSIIAQLHVKAATDVTGFGLGGHVLEMAIASHKHVYLFANAIPLLNEVYALTSMGLVPVGSYANKAYRACNTIIEPSVDPFLIDIIFDAQTSGGLVLAVPKPLVNEALTMLAEQNETGYIIGQVGKTAQPHDKKLLHIVTS